MLAGTGTDPRRQAPETIDHRIAERVRGTLEYWDSITHAHAFNLPKFIRRAIERQDRIITDENPLIVT
jgi:hypothetical protein